MTRSNLTVLILFSTILTACSTSEFVVFSSGRDGNSNIYIMDADGQNQQALTQNQAEEWGPTVMNAHEITFLRDEDGEIKRYKLNLETLEESPLPHPAECILDDKNIIYGLKTARMLYQCEGDIFVCDANGENKINLTRDLNGIAIKPSWFPGEDRATFTSNHTGNNEVYAIDISGENLINLTAHPSNDEAGEVSPNGKYLLFSSSRDGENNQDLYILDLETQEIENITQTSDWELIGRWSGDGQRIYFGSNKDGNWEIYVYERASRSTHRLSRNEVFDGDPRIIK